MAVKAVVVQLGGAAPVVNKTLVSISRKLMESGAEVLGAKNGIEGILTNTYMSMMNEQKLEIIDRMPGAALGTSEIKVTNGDSNKKILVSDSLERQEVSAEEISYSLKKQDIHYIYMIGGDSTAWIANEILKAAQKDNYDLTVVHVLKTIDNDVLLTDHALGYGSCARYVATAAHTINQVNRTKRGIHVIITMGRDAGYIAASAALLEGADLVYVPEVHFNIDCFLNDVKDVLSMNQRTNGGKGRAVIALSEGIRQYEYDERGQIRMNNHGKPIYRLMADIAGEKLQTAIEKEKNLNGTALSVGSKSLELFIYRLLRENYPDDRIRTDVLGYPQQGYPDLSETDVYEARHNGKIAVMNSFGKARSGSVIMERVGNADTYAIKTRFVELDEISKGTKQMPRNYMSHYGKQATDVYLEYGAPLIGYVDGFGNLEYLLSKPLDPKEFIKD